MDRNFVTHRRLAHGTDEINPVLSFDEHLKAILLRDLPWQGLAVINEKSLAWTQHCITGLSFLH